MSERVIENFFVCVGAQKAGTTWLARVLATHPDLFLTPVKEIHYFDHVRGITEHLSDKKRQSRYRKFHQRMWTQWHKFSDFRDQWPWYRDYMRNPINDDWYMSLFRHRGAQRFAGEVTPEYAIVGREGFAHLHRLAPDARVLFIMRNPVTRAWSQVLHHCRSNGLDALRQSLDAISTLVDSERFRALSDYPATLDDIAATFPHEQVKTLFYEDIHQDRQKAIAQVCAFIGISFDPAWFPELGRRFNRSQDAALPEPVRAHLRELYRDTALEVRARIGRVPESWDREFATQPATSGG